MKKFKFNKKDYFIIYINHMELNVNNKSLLYLIILNCIFVIIFEFVNCIEQKLIIDLEQNRGTSRQNNFYKSQNFQNNKNEKINFENKLLIDNFYIKNKNNYPSTLLSHYKSQPFQTLNEILSTTEVNKTYFKIKKKIILDKKFDL